jgi:hypothetical protein
MMFLEARRIFGENTLDAMCKFLHNKNAGNRQATTATFLEEVKTFMGIEALSFFQDQLFRPYEISNKNLSLS